MKIAVLTDGIYPFVIGGMQKHSHYLSAFLAREGDEITLVHCIPYGKKKPSEDLVRKELGLEDHHYLKSIVVGFPKPGVLPGHYLKESFEYSRGVFQAIKEELNSFDLIYAKGFSSWYLLDQKRKGLKTPPVIIKFHGYEMFQKPPSFKSRFEHWMLRGPVKFHHKHADFVFSYGAKITSIIKGLGVKNESIRDIPTGIASIWCNKEIKAIEGSKRKFIFVGRYERRKGVEELNAAITELAKTHDFELHMVGPIPASKKIQSDKVIYHGKVMDLDQMKSLLDSCEVLLTPSHSEGMPNVIMEGMARGLAVLATDVGAVSEQVGPENGWLVKPGDTEDLKSSLINIVECSASALISKRNASLQKVKDKFTWEQVIAQTRKAFISCLPEPK